MHTYMLTVPIITIPNTTAADAAPNNRNKKVIFKICTPFTNCVSEINNTQVDNALDIDVVMSMWNSIGYSDIYSKKIVSLWQYYRDEPTLGAFDNIIDFPADNNDCISFKFKQKTTGPKENDDTKISK